jgi:outer membrane lipoprotein SlyB
MRRRLRAVRSARLRHGAVPDRRDQNKKSVPRRIEVGGGALIGTIIGAVVGHGKGAAIGAAVGAAGGAEAEVLTKGKQVSIPAETVLTFSLNNSVTLAPDEQ